MVDLSLCRPRSFLDYFPTLIFFTALALPVTAYSQAAEVIKLGTVRTQNAKEARIAAVKAIDPVTKKVTAVIDARDRFGNPVRITRQLTPIRSRVAQYAKQCIGRGGWTGVAVCAAIPAITAAAAYYGYEYLNGQVLYPNTGHMDECSTDTITVRYGEGVNITGVIPGIPCVDTRYSTRIRYKTDMASDAHSEWALHSPIITSTNQKFLYWSAFDKSQIKSKVLEAESQQTLPVSIGDLYTYTRNVTAENPAVMPSIEALPLSDADYEKLVFHNPEMGLQVQPGIYPDVWEAINVDEIAEGTDEPIRPDVDSDDYDMGMDDIPTEDVDLFEFLSWGDGWLPKKCPEPVVFPIFDKNFHFEYDIACDIAEDYISIFMRLMGLVSFITIVFGGLRSE